MGLSIFQVFFIYK